MAAKDPVLPASKTLIHLADRAVLLHFNRAIHKQQEESARIVTTLPRRNITTVFAKQEQGSWPVSGQMNAEKYTLYIDVYQVPSWQISVRKYVMQVRPTGVVRTQEAYLHGPSAKGL